MKKEIAIRKLLGICFFSTGIIFLLFSSYSNITGNVIGKIPGTSFGFFSFAGLTLVLISIILFLFGRFNSKKV